MEPVPLAMLEAGLNHILESPKDDGVVELLVRRPKVNLREVIPAGRVEPEAGLVGDHWVNRGGRGNEEAADRDVQLTLMNARSIALIAGDREHWPLAGDQLYVDLDLSSENLPPGTRLAIGTAIIAITKQPHTGCGKFRNRFGADALAFVNSPQGRLLNLRGVNAKIVQAGDIRVGDRLVKCNS